MLRRLHELQPILAIKESQLREAIAMLTKNPRGKFFDQTFSKDIITTVVNVTTKRPLGNVHHQAG